jgi:hypothetical protein
MAIQQSELDQAQVAHQQNQAWQLQLHERIEQLQVNPKNNMPSRPRLSVNPDKFSGTETNITKRHQSYVTFEDRASNCIEQDRHVFDTKFQRIHFIGSLLVHDAYEAVRDGLCTVKHDTDPSTWKWATYTSVFKYLRSIYATTNIAWNAKMELNKLSMGSLQFANFLSPFVLYANRCQQPPSQKG